MNGDADAKQCDTMQYNIQSVEQHTAVCLIETVVRCEREKEKHTHTRAHSPQIQPNKTDDEKKNEQHISLRNRHRRQKREP